MQRTTAENTFRCLWTRTKYTEDQYELHNETDTMGDGGEKELVSSLIMKYNLSDARIQGRTWRDSQKTEAWKTVRNERLDFWRLALSRWQEFDDEETPRN
jgi:hypothetical protein